MSIESELAIKKKEDIDKWRARARSVVIAAKELTPILKNRKGVFNIQEWNKIQEFIDLVEV